MTRTSRERRLAGAAAAKGGRGFRIRIIQFIKSAAFNTGEATAAQRLNIEWHKSGDGFTWLTRDTKETTALACHGWQLAQEKISVGAYDLVVLDEFTYPLRSGWLSNTEVVDWLSANKPEPLHLIITGRYAPEPLIDYADLVAEMRLIQHPY